MGVCIGVCRGMYRGMYRGMNSGRSIIGNSISCAVLTTDKGSILIKLYMYVYIYIILAGGGQSLELRSQSPVYPYDPFYGGLGFPSYFPFSFPFDSPFLGSSIPI